jgi:hypothetical protein
MSGRRQRRRRGASGRPVTAPRAPQAPTTARVPQGQRARARQGAAAPAGPDWDLPTLLRGASAGFTVLVLGELLAPLAGALSPVLAGLWLSLVGAAGFAVAGRRIGHARRTVLQGAAAALAALTLTLPLRLLAGTQVSPYALAVSAVFALVVGGLAGRAAGSLRDRRP